MVTSLMETNNMLMRLVSVKLHVNKGHIHTSILPQPKARSAVPGVSRGRGLLIPLSFSEVQSRCLWALVVRFLALGRSLISIL